MRKTFMIFCIMLTIMFTLSSCIFGYQTGSVEFRYTNDLNVEKTLIIEPADSDNVYFKEYKLKILQNEFKVTERNTISWYGFDQKRTSVINVRITYTSTAGASVDDSFKQEITSLAGRDNYFYIHPQLALPEE